MREVLVYIELEVDPTCLCVGRPEARAEHAAPRGDHAVVRIQSAAASCEVTRAAAGATVLWGQRGYWPTWQGRCPRDNR